MWARDEMCNHLIKAPWLCWSNLFSWCIRWTIYPDNSLWQETPELEASDEASNGTPRFRSVRADNIWIFWICSQYSFSIYPDNSLRQQTIEHKTLYIFPLWIKKICILWIWTQYSCSVYADNSLRQEPPELEASYGAPNAIHISSMPQKDLYILDLNTVFVIYIPWK